MPRCRKIIIKEKIKIMKASLHSLPILCLGNIFWRRKSYWSFCENQDESNKVSHSSRMQPVARHPTTIWNDNWDGRDYKTNPNPNIVHQIVLVRHGQYHRNYQELLQTAVASDIPILTETGQQQAKLTGQRLIALLNKGILYKPDRIYYSTLQRAVETWQIMHNQLPSDSSSSHSFPAAHHIQPCSMIAEVVPFKPIPEESTWQVRDETFFKDQQRAEAAFLQYFHRPDHHKTESYSTILICHGNMIRYLVSRALQLPPETWKRIAVWNGSISVIEVYANGRVSLRFLSDVGHLPVDLVTYG